MATPNRSKPRENADDRLAGFLREAQGFAIYFRLGIVTRDEIRDFLRAERGLDLPALPDGFEPPEVYVPPPASPPLPPTEDEIDEMDPAELLAHLGAAPNGAALEGVVPTPGDDRDGPYRPNPYEPLLRED